MNKISDNDFFDEYYTKEDLEKDRRDSIMEFLDETQRWVSHWDAEINKIDDNFYQAEVLVFVGYHGIDDWGVQTDDIFDPSLISICTEIYDFKYEGFEIECGGLCVSENYYDCNFYQKELDPKVADMIETWLGSFLSRYEDNPAESGIDVEKIRDLKIRKHLIDIGL